MDRLVLRRYKVQMNQAFEARTPGASEQIGAGLKNRLSMGSEIIHASGPLLFKF